MITSVDRMDIANKSVFNPPTKLEKKESKKNRLRQVDASTVDFLGPWAGKEVDEAAV